jgi:tRNA 2-thiouridine synthesizing protein A
MPDVRLDTTGLSCPLPILKAKKAIKRVPAGGTLEVIATDPGAVEDFETFCRVSGHSLVESSQQDGVYRFLIRLAG